MATQALFVLIPKEMKPSNMRGFRPLSLCNTIYKLISKILVNRLKEAWRGLILTFQASFVLGHQSTGNVILCQDFVHSFRSTKARRGAMILKVDLEKAYNCLEWPLIEESLLDAGLPIELVGVIMWMISSGSCKLMWNGNATDVIRPSRELRQGFPLSP